MNTTIKVAVSSILIIATGIFLQSAVLCSPIVHCTSSFQDLHDHRIPAAFILFSRDAAAVTLIALCTLEAILLIAASWIYFIPLLFSLLHYASQINVFTNTCLRMGCLNSTVFASFFIFLITALLSLWLQRSAANLSPVAD